MSIFCLSLFSVLVLFADFVFVVFVFIFACIGCLYEGQEYQNGDPLLTSDPCRECTCEMGSVSCSYTRCDQVGCPRPYTPPGQCCAVCQGKIKSLRFHLADWGFLGVTVNVAYLTNLLSFSETSHNLHSSLDKSA